MPKSNERKIKFIPPPELPKSIQELQDIREQIYEMMGIPYELTGIPTVSKRPGGNVGVEDIMKEGRKDGRVADHKTVDAIVKVLDKRVDRLLKLHDEARAKGNENDQIEAGFRCQEAKLIRDGIANGGF